MAQLREHTLLDNDDDEVDDDLARSLVILPIVVMLDGVLVKLKG